MRKIYVPLILFFLVVLEGVSQDLLPESISSNDIILVSHWVFIFLILIASFFDENNSFYALVFALIFGLLIDIVYTDLLGIYMFAYTITIFIYQQTIRYFQTNFIMVFLFTILSLFLVDHIIYLLYMVIGKISLPWKVYFFQRMLPTLLANIVFFLILFPIFKNRLLFWSGREE